MPSNEIKTFIDKQNKLGTLKYITCGSVDDGKSTLLGRMLYEAQMLFDDQVENLVKDSKKIGTQQDKIDFALLVDGLSAEREQGITIDVAYRFFSTDKRKFIVADSPGHEQYTRNMVTAASNADLAIILIDARNGIMPQTKRHSFITNLMGIKKIIVAVNKMDLVNYKESIFETLKENYLEQISSKLDFEEIFFVPVSALEGDNVVTKSKKMSWFNGDSLMTLLETVEISKNSDSSFLMPIQYVSRPNQNFRGYSGTVCSGSLSQGNKVFVNGSDEYARVKEIFLGDNKTNSCISGDSVTITLDKEIDISRGDLLSLEKNQIEKNKGFLTNIVWFDTERGFQNRRYLLKSSNSQMNCELVKIKNKVDVNTYEKIIANKIEMNDIVECEILFDQDVVLQPFEANKTLGSFILIDKKTNLTVAAGTIKHPLRKSTNVSRQDTDINIDSRRKLLNQKSFILWFTGLSGAGKSTIANLLEKALHKNGYLTYLLDGDNLRLGINKDLGFKEEDRIENLRRVGEISKIIYDSGAIVLASFISPFKKDRKQIKRLFPRGEFIEIYVKASLDSLKDRDPKGLYKKALNGKIPNFTGISSPYEEPLNPDIEINTEEMKPEDAVKIILSYLEENK